MTTINKVQLNNCNLLYKGKNVFKNLTNYTYNILPRTKDAIKTGNEEGLKIAQQNNAGKFKTFLSKNITPAKILQSQSTNMNYR